MFYLVFLPKHFDPTLQQKCTTSKQLKEKKKEKTLELGKLKEREKDGANIIKQLA